MGCRQDLPFFGSTILLYVPPPVRRGEDSGARLQVFPKSLSAFPEARAGRLPHLPDTGFCRDLITTLQSSLHATARRVARPPVPIRPGDQPPADEDFYT